MLLSSTEENDALLLQLLKTHFTIYRCSTQFSHNVGAQIIMEVLYPFGKLTYCLLSIQNVVTQILSS